MTELEDFKGRFQSFNIEDKSKELKSVVNDSLLGQHVVVAVPTLDERMRLIYLEDQALYDTQKNDSYVLAQYIVYTLGAETVSMFFKFDRVTEHVDYVIFLHKFMAFEKNAILEKLMEHNPNLKYFEIY